MQRLQIETPMLILVPYHQGLIVGLAPAQPVACIPSLGLQQQLEALAAC